MWLENSTTCMVDVTTYFADMYSTLNRTNSVVMFQTIFSRTRTPKASTHWNPVKRKNQFVWRTLLCHGFHSLRDILLDLDKMQILPHHAALAVDLVSDTCRCDIAGSIILPSHTAQLQWHKQFCYRSRYLPAASVVENQCFYRNTFTKKAFYRPLYFRLFTNQWMCAKNLSTNWWEPRCTTCACTRLSRKKANHPGELRSVCWVDWFWDFDFDFETSEQNKQSRLHQPSLWISSMPFGQHCEGLGSSQLFRLCQLGLMFFVVTNRSHTRLFVYLLVPLPSNWIRSDRDWTWL